MSVSRLEYITKIGVEQMGDLADSLDDPRCITPRESRYADLTTAAICSRFHQARR